MAKLEMFFDYACPYCKEGYEVLEGLLKEEPGLAPGLEIEWLAGEAHPRPEKWERYSDLCAMGMYIARDQGVDYDVFHKAMYEAAITNKGSVNIEDADSLTEAVAHVLPDKGAFAKALREAKYAERVVQNNSVCWGELGFEAVPSFRMGKATLSAVWHVGITKEGLAAFIKENA